MSVSVVISWGRVVHSGFLICCTLSKFIRFLIRRFSANSAAARFVGPVRFAGPEVAAFSRHLQRRVDFASLRKLGDAALSPFSV
ncbi:hypothetical protein KCP77_12140 [Salmonella enterica subsp. enterica]|nr:hypothetical protein KCP77_12140 [Salmonella enterica subsp. enterica]